MKKYFLSNIKKYTKINGFSLIEMLVGIALLGFLVATQMQIVQTVMHQYHDKQKIIQTLDDQVFLSDIISSHQTMLNANSENIKISHFNNRVRISRTARIQNRNCLGTLVEKNSIVMDEFFLENNEFKCRSQYLSESVARTDSQPIVANVESLKWNWGVINLSSTWSAIHWQSVAPGSTTVIAALNWTVNFLKPVPLSWKSIHQLYVYPLQDSDYLDVVIEPAAN